MKNSRSYTTFFTLMEEYEFDFLLPLLCPVAVLLRKSEWNIFPYERPFLS